MGRIVRQNQKSQIAKPAGAAVYLDANDSDFYGDRAS